MRLQRSSPPSRHAGTAMRPIPVTSLSIILLSTLLLAPSCSLAATPPAGTCETYNGALFTSIITWPVFVPAGSSVATIEQSILARGFALLAGVGKSDPACVAAFTNLTAFESFPYCSNGKCSVMDDGPAPDDGGPGGRGNDDGTIAELPCLSACQKAVTSCTTLFTSLNQPGRLPHCENGVVTNGVSYGAYPAAGVACLPDNPPAVIVAPAPAPASSPAALSQCPAPLLPDPNAGTNVTVDQRLCSVGCCMPCPVLNNFYKPGLLDTYLNVADILRLVSAAGSLFVFISFLVLPGKKQHPSAIILYFSLAMVLFGSCPLFIQGGRVRRSAQCADEITTASITNNLLCGHLTPNVSGRASNFGIKSILNLHTVTVWSSNLFQGKYVFVHLVNWGLPAVFTGVTVLVKGIRYEFGSMCLISSDWSNQLFFYPLAVVIIGSFVLHLFTAFIARIALRAGSSNALSHNRSRSLGASVSQITTSDGDIKVSSRTRVLMIWNSSWRSFTLSFVFAITFMVVWIFYFDQIAKMKSYDSTTSFIQNWGICLAAGGTQESCAHVANGYVPDYAFMVVAEILPSIAGLWIFLIFGCRSSLMADWQAYFHDRAQSRRSRRDSGDSPGSADGSNDSGELANNGQRNAYGGAALSNGSFAARSLKLEPIVDPAELDKSDGSYTWDAPEPFYTPPVNPAVASPEYRASPPPTRLATAITTNTIQQSPVNSPGATSPPLSPHASQARRYVTPQPQLVAPTRVVSVEPRHPQRRFDPPPARIPAGYGAGAWEGGNAQEHNRWAQQQQQGYQYESDGRREHQ
ncbi:hypothetical protein HK101_010821 [Irineochytrium annulatum]|nr:hypothetical protein HK101_010821 [Irineochytrium annulatum]